jgi:hypothetical protein
MEEVQGSSPCISTRNYLSLRPVFAGLFVYLLQKIWYKIAVRIISHRLRERHARPGQRPGTRRSERPFDARSAVPGHSHPVRRHDHRAALRHQLHRRHRRRTPRPLVVPAGHRPRPGHAHHDHPGPPAPEALPEDQAPKGTLDAPLQPRAGGFTSAGPHSCLLAVRNMGC